jgi:hypothetical protein
MTRQRHIRKVIDHPDQVPDSFKSEDEEREWWANHDFSRRYVERSHPGWDGIGQFLFAPRVATRVPHVEHALRIARKHLARVRPERPLERSPFYEARYEHAISAIIFSAAAVEAGLNLYLLAPKLRVSSDFKTVVVGLPEEVRLPAHRKLKIVSKSCEALHRPPELVRRVEELLTRRDALAHALPPNRGDAEQDLRRAREHYEAAYAFLDRLLLPAIDNRVIEDA